MYYEIQGEGQPVMLIAGLASDSQSWGPVKGSLAQHFQIIAPDNRGVGRTKPQDCETSINRIADDRIELIRSLGYQSVHLLGHSMGGFVALDCAIRYPEYVDKLILASTSAINSKRNNELFSDWVSYLESGMEMNLWFRNLFYWLFTGRFFENRKALNDAVLLAVNYPYPQEASAFKKQVEAINSFDCSSDLSKISSETLIIHGKEDLLFPPEESTEILQEIPKETFRVIEHAAHSVHMEQPEEFCHLLVNFAQ